MSGQEGSNNNITTIESHGVKIVIDPKARTVTIETSEVSVSDSPRGTKFCLSAIGADTIDDIPSQDVIDFIRVTKIGTKMSDGTIYVGQRPDAQYVPIFTPPLPDLLTSKLIIEITQHLKEINTGNTDACFDTCGYTDWQLGHFDACKTVFMAVILGKAPEIKLKPKVNYPCLPSDPTQHDAHSKMCHSRGKAHQFREEPLPIFSQRLYHWFPVRYGLPEGVTPKP